MSDAWSKVWGHVTTSRIPSTETKIISEIENGLLAIFLTTTRQKLSTRRRLTLVRRRERFRWISSCVVEEVIIFSFSWDRLKFHRMLKCCTCIMVIFWEGHFTIIYLPVIFVETERCELVLLKKGNLLKWVRFCHWSFSRNGKEGMRFLFQLKSRIGLSRETKPWTKRKWHRRAKGRQSTVDFCGDKLCLSKWFLVHIKYQLTWLVNHKGYGKFTSQDRTEKGDTGEYRYTQSVAIENNVFVRSFI